MIAPTKAVAVLAIILVFVVGIVPHTYLFGYLLAGFLFPAVPIMAAVNAAISPSDDWDIAFIAASLLVALFIWCTLFWGAWRYGKAKSVGL